MLVAFEGIDGSGKGTQARLLCDRARREGFTSRVISFPQYGQNVFADAIVDYLAGRFGSVDEVHGKLAALLYAGDRFSTKSTLEDMVRENELVVCDRYVPSNAAYQAAKLPQAERIKFIRWLYSVEYGAFKLPEPQLVLLLDMPVSDAQRLVSKKPPRDQLGLFADDAPLGYTSQKADIHEVDSSFLGRCREVYEYLAENDSHGSWIKLSCVDGRGRLKARESISEETWEAVEKYGLRSHN